MSDPISAMEVALVDRIKAITRLKFVESIAADLNNEDFLRRFPVNAPAIYISFGGGSPGQARAGTTAQIQARWGVFVGTGHANNEIARRRGDTTMPGAYQLLDVVIRGLHGFRIPDVGTPSLVAVENLYDGDFEKRGLTVYSAVFDVPMAWPSVADPEALKPFMTFGDYWDIPTFESDGERNKWLAGDESTSKPDAKDNVSLPQS